jgi:methylphosphotriester-DNA--protein-cysteine methyltransferase
MSDDRLAQKARSCLRCSRMFPSKNAGNRICPRCKQRDVSSTISQTAMRVTTIVEAIHEDSAERSWRDV